MLTTRCNLEIHTHQNVKKRSTLCISCMKLISITVAGSAHFFCLCAISSFVIELDSYCTVVVVEFKVDSKFSPTYSFGDQEMVLLWILGLFFSVVNAVTCNSGNCVFDCGSKDCSEVICTDTATSC